MNVYLVIYTDCDGGDEVKGVFSTEELANEFKEKYGNSDWYVEEVEVDKYVAKLRNPEQLYNVMIGVDGKNPNAYIEFKTTSPINKVSNIRFGRVFQAYVYAKSKANAINKLIELVKQQVVY